jgi:signal peptidase II
LKPMTVSQKLNSRIFALALFIFALDQFSKWLVLRSFYPGEEKTIIPDFFKLIHRDNTGAAWSLFTGNNTVLALIAIIALVALFFTRKHFNVHTFFGQIAFGLIFGGIAGNLTDRLLPARHAVVDFLYFYLPRRGGDELGFPVFNFADSAICVGVTIIFLISWKNENTPRPAETAS